MRETFITEVQIHKVRHLRDITIPLSTETRKHLILTGKNGSGKTSVLEEIKRHIVYLLSSNFDTREEIENLIDIESRTIARKSDPLEKQEHIKHLDRWNKRLKCWTEGVVTRVNSVADVRDKFEKGLFITAFYQTGRISSVDHYTNIENVRLKEKYSIDENPGKLLTKYLVNLKATQAFSNQKSKESKRSQEIDEWFERFQNILRDVFEDEALELMFNPEDFQFSIHATNREPFDFNTMSSGYAAVFDIINDLIMRMEAKHDYNLEGIVLIDEIETHLHLELEKKILPILTGLFPKIQFIVTTHSPFILSSLDDVVIYDLQNHQLVLNGMTNLPYEGIVEGYFGADKLSKELREKFERYKKMAQKEQLSDDDYVELDELELYLDEIPDYLALDIAGEYQRLKLEMDNRGV